MSSIKDKLKIKISRERTRSSGINITKLTDIKGNDNLQTPDEEEKEYQIKQFYIPNIIVPEYLNEEDTSSSNDSNEEEDLSY